MNMQIMTGTAATVKQNEKNLIFDKITEIKIMGLSLPVYIVVAAIILFAAATEILPVNMVGALAIMIVLGSVFNLMGSKIPVIRSYLGGGAVFCIFASSALATFGILPASVVENCKSFMNEVGFLDFYISALITGSILGMSRTLLKKAAVRFLPVSFISMTCAILMAGVAGMITGRGFSESILYIALPMMSGGMGTGLLFSITFFTIGALINKIFPNVHAYAFMIIIVVICKIIGFIPGKYEYVAVQWGQFVMKNFTHALLAGIGIALLDLKVLGASLSPQFLVICVVIIMTVALVAGLLGKLAGFYPVESSITAGLCTNSMGGTGNIAVLSAAERMELIPFAQMATRLGGAMILISSSFLIQLLG